MIGLRSGRIPEVTKLDKPKKLLGFITYAGAVLLLLTSILLLHTGNGHRLLGGCQHNLSLSWVKWGKNKMRVQLFHRQATNGVSHLLVFVLATDGVGSSCVR